MRLRNACRPISRTPEPDLAEAIFHFALTDPSIISRWTLQQQICPTTGNLAATLSLMRTMLTDKQAEENLLEQAGRPLAHQAMLATREAALGAAETALAQATAALDVQVAAISRGVDPRRSGRKGGKEGGGRRGGDGGHGSGRSGGGARGGARFAGANSQLGACGPPARRGWPDNQVD